MWSSSHGVKTLGKRKEREAVNAKAEPVADNRILAGYLAHEFLTKGTLFGQKWDPARAAAAAADPARGPRSDKKPVADSHLHADQRAEPGAYADVAHLIMSEGTHIPGIVNPTQLGRWMQM